MDFTSNLNAYSSLIQAIATAVLVLVNLYYLRLVSRSVQQVERAQKSEFMPIVTMRAEATEENALDVYLSNTGNGMAQSPEIFVPFEREPQYTDTIAPKQENVLVSFKNLGTAEIFEVPEEDRKLRVEYQDIFGRTIISEAIIVAQKDETGEPDEQRLALADLHIIPPAV